jgi:hypothetical protein
VWSFSCQVRELQAWVTAYNMIQRNLEEWWLEEWCNGVEEERLRGVVEREEEEENGRESDDLDRRVCSSATMRDINEPERTVPTEDQDLLAYSTFSDHRPCSML